MICSKGGSVLLVWVLVRRKLVDRVIGSTTKRVCPTIIAMSPRSLCHGKFSWRDHPNSIAPEGACVCAVSVLRTQRPHHSRVQDRTHHVSVMLRDCRAGLRSWVLPDTILHGKPKGRYTQMLHVSPDSCNLRASLKSKPQVAIKSIPCSTPGSRRRSCIAPFIKSCGVAASGTFASDRVALPASLAALPCASARYRWQCVQYSTNAVLFGAACLDCALGHCLSGLCSWTIVRVEPLRLRFFENHLALCNVLTAHAGDSQRSNTSLDSVPF